MSNKPQMVTGFNHNIKHGGQIYHIQTEDSGISNPHIITHLFVGGNILATKKTSYADIVNADNLQNIVRELMQEQHKAMLRNLINGVYDAIASTSASPPNMPIGTEPSLPDKFPVPAQGQQKSSSPKPAQPALTTLQKDTKKPQPMQAGVTQPPSPSATRPLTASAQLPKVVPTPVPKSQPPQAPQNTNQQDVPARKPPQTIDTTTQVQRRSTAQTPVTNSGQSPTSSAGIKVKPPIKTTGSSGGFSRPKTSPKIFLPKETEKVPPGKSSKPKVSIQTKKTVVKPSASVSSLPPEVLAARRLSDKPKPKDTSGPTIFGENLISEKSLDEVILGYLAGNDDDKS